MAKARIALSYIFEPLGDLCLGELVSHHVHRSISSLVLDNKEDYVHKVHS